MKAGRYSRRWWLFALLILAGQVAAIFWLSDNTAPAVRRPSPAPSITVVASPDNEFFALNDPTIFALPHARGFSGKAWRSLPGIPARSFEWNAELQWLPLPVSQLGQGLGRFLQAARDEPVTAFSAPEPSLIQPEPPSTQVFAQKSTVRLEGALRHRRLLTPIEPSSWPHSDLLTNTIIDLIVGLDGLPISCELRPPGSGSLQADQQALALARATRFASLVSSGPRRDTNSAPVANLARGTLIFQWRTLPQTNATTPP
jgi:hypothetical protein